jgi:chitinase
LLGFDICFRQIQSFLEKSNRVTLSLLGVTPCCGIRPDCLAHVENDMTKPFIFLIISVFLRFTVLAQVVIDEPIVLGYFPSWSESWTTTDQNSTLREVPSFVNYVFLSFAKPDLTYTQGTYDISQTGIQVPYDGCTLKESVSSLNDKGIKVILSIGGETYWTSNNIYNDINYLQIKDLVDDMGFAGIDWDFEPNGSFGQIGSVENVQHYIDFFTNSRALMPRSEGYIMTCAPSGVGALGGLTNDDETSPYSYANRNNVTGESDVNLYNASAQTNGINLYGFSSTGHMIPVIQSIGNEIDIIAFQGYNAGASLNRSIMYDAYAYYAESFGFKVAAGVHFPNEPWGPHYEYTQENVANLSNHIATHPDRIGDNDGIMIWQLLLTSGDSSAYAYMNIADRILNGEGVVSAISNSQNFSMENYSGGAEGCGGNQVGVSCGYADYNVISSYSSPGIHVYYDCAIWQNQWWANPGEAPGSNNVWTYVSECLEEPGCSITGIEQGNSELFTIRSTSNGLTIEFKGSSSSNKYEIRDMSARLVASGGLVSETLDIDLSGMAAGAHTISVGMTSIRFVVQ